MKKFLTLAAALTVALASAACSGPSAECVSKNGSPMKCSVSITDSAK